MYFKLLCHASFDGCGVNTDPTGYGIAQGETKGEGTISAVSRSTDWYICPHSAAEESEGDVTNLEPRCSRMKHQEVKLVPVAACSSSVVLCSSPTLLHISSVSLRQGSTAAALIKGREAGWDQKHQ